jgi:hypothetical protein
MIGMLLVCLGAAINRPVDQQIFLEDRQRGKRWTWSAIRPSVVCGFALGNPMNLAMVIAVYAAIFEGTRVAIAFSR